MTGDVFSVDVPLGEEWLAAALETRRAGGLVRVTVVVTNAGPDAGYKAVALGGGDADYMVAAVAGDFTREPAYRGADRG